jgi:hypothetical protein
MQRREFFGGLGLGAAGLALPTDGPATAGEASDDRAQRRALFLDLAKRGLERAVDPASPDCMNFTDGSQPLVDAASSARSLRKRRSLSTAGRSPTASGRFTCWPRVVDARPPLRTRGCRRHRGHGCSPRACPPMGTWDPQR